MGEDLIELTIKTWQPISPEPLTAEDAAEIVDSVSGFVAALRRWQTLADFSGPSLTFRSDRPGAGLPSAPARPGRGVEE
jgi:hypothetical protein